ncbi:MAG: CotH kinase family protein [Dysgonamonadaceae bacterium]|jgi:hypothetical protein|nr:CotH kinase family protein [Dysgonamonadaceae bacterium]
MRKTGILIALSLSISLALFAQSETVLFTPDGIAEMHITLADGKQIGDIKNEKANDDYAGKVDATLSIRNSVSSTYEHSLLYTGNIRIDGRGNTSWHHDKRPYNIDLVGDDWNVERPAKLLGMGENDEWCLLAFWMDRSLMRQPLAAWLGKQMQGIPWMPGNRYVEVWINGDYRGLYALSEKVQRGDHNINIKKLDAASTDLSGGYILEASPEDGHKSTPIEIATQIKTSREGINFIFKYPKAKNVTQNQRAWIKNHLDEFETALRSDDFKSEDTGYRKYIEENSFIDWVILHELTKGCDNLFHASVFVQKDRNGKLQMSAPWDFDLSFGNSTIYAEEGNWVKSHGRWFGRLYQDERYAGKFNERYDELFPLFRQIPEVLRQNYEQLENSGVLERENQRFPHILTEYVNEDGGRPAPFTYRGHVQYLSDWATSRNNWVYINLGQTDEEKGARMQQIRPVIRVVTPENRWDEKSFEVKVMKSEENNNRYEYSWNDESFRTASTRTILSSQKGKYWVKIKDEWGNISLASDTLYFGVPVPTGIENQKPVVSPSVYYLPEEKQIHLSYPLTGAGELSADLFDIRGRLVSAQRFRQDQGGGTFHLSTLGMAKGIYLLRLRSEGQCTTFKIAL